MSTLACRRHSSVSYGQRQDQQHCPGQPNTKPKSSANPIQNTSSTGSSTSASHGADATPIQSITPTVTSIAQNLALAGEVQRAVRAG